MNTMWFGYYATSKWGRKPLIGLNWAKASFWIMEAAVILIFLSNPLGFGAGWYDLMPLTFLPGNPQVTWNSMAATIFLIGDVFVGISLTIFCIIVIATLLIGSIPSGTQKFVSRHNEVREQKEEEEREEKEKQSKDNESKKEVKETDQPKIIQDLDHTHMENIPASVRWVSLLGISSWFPKNGDRLPPLYQ